MLHHQKPTLLTKLALTISKYLQNMDLMKLDTEITKDAEVDVYDLDQLETRVKSETKFTGRLKVIFSKSSFRTMKNLHKIEYCTDREIWIEEGKQDGSR